MMSKERARRRAVREHEAALRASARVAEDERRERRAARGKALRAATGRLPRRTPAGRDTGTLARRRRTRVRLLVAGLAALNVLVWVVRPDWPSRFAAIVVSVLAAPAMATLLFPRRP